MSLRYVESFGWMPQGLSAAAADVLFAKAGYWSWANAFNGAIVAGVWAGSTAVSIGGEVGVFAKLRAMPIPGPTFTLGIRLNRAPLSSANPVLCLFNSVTGHIQMSVVFAEYGVVQVWRGHPAQGGSVQIAQSAGGSFLNDVDFMAEFQGTADPSAGAAIVKVNAGITSPLTGIVIDQTALNSSFDGTSTNVDMVGWGTTQGSSGGFTAMDFYVTDPAGSVNTGFLGNVKAQWLTTSGPGASTELTIGGSAPAATNWQSVKDYALDEAQFVETATVGDYDQYTLEALVTPGTIFGVQSRVFMRQDDATQLSGQAVVTSGATTVDGAEHLLNETQAGYVDMFEADPDTSAAWLAAAVNSLQLGPKLAASA